MSGPRDTSISPERRRHCPSCGAPLTDHELRQIPSMAKSGTSDVLFNTATKSFCWSTLGRITSDMRRALRPERPEEDRP